MAALEGPCGDLERPEGRGGPAWPDLAEEVCRAGSGERMAAKGYGKRWADGSARHREAWRRPGDRFGRVGELEGARAGCSLALLFEQSGEAATFGQGELQGLDLPHQPAGAAPAKEPLGPLRIALGAGCLHHCAARASDSPHR